MVQLLVSDGQRLLVGIVGFPDDSRLISTFIEMPIDTVGCDVQCSVFVPADIDVAGSKACVLDYGVGPNPVDTLSLPSPEGIGIGK